MFARYRAAFRPPGTRAFSAAAFLGRMPIAIYPLTLVLLFSATSGGASGTYGVAGVMTGVYIIAGGIGNPVLARLVDRHGQSRLLVPAALVHVAAATVLIVTVRAGAPNWLVAVPVAALGLAYLPMGSLVRARWSSALAGTPELGTAYSLESTFDELIFAIGPVFAGVIAVAVSALAAVGTAAALVLAGSIWLARQTSTAPPVAAAGEHEATFVLRWPGMVLLTVAMAGLGAIFGSVEVTMVAFTGQHGDRNLTGIVLAVFALGSGVAGIGYGARTWSAPLSWRFCLQAGIFAALLPLFLLADSVPTLAVLAFVAGLGIAPTLITGFGLIDSLVPPRSLTEGLSWMTTGLNFGYGTGAAVVGVVADRYGAHAAFGAPIAAGVVLFGAAVAVRGRVRSVAAWSSR